MDTGPFLLQIIFTIYLVTIFLRILLPSFKASYHSPLSQFVIKVTNPFILPLRKIIPSHRYIDFAAIALLIIVEFIKLYLYYWWAGDTLLSITDAMILCVGELLQLVIMIFFWSIIIQSVISWIATPERSFGTLQNTLYHLTNWMLKPVRKIIPPIGMFDLAPIPIMIVLYFLFHFINAYTLGFVNV
tara:strand:- start:4124 stop:4684 length:561 start_codon:yes stop_codon:yes gene_type:complete